MALLEGAEASTSMEQQIINQRLIGGRVLNAEWVS